MKRAVLAGAACAVLALCVVGAGVRPAFDVRALGAFVRGVFPPDLSPPFLQVVGLAVARTLGIAVAGTALSVLGGLPLGILATPSLFRRGPLLAGERPGAPRAPSSVSCARSPTWCGRSCSWWDSVSVRCPERLRWE